MKIRIHPTLYLLAILIIIWEFVVNYFEIASYILPVPSKIITRIYVDIDLLLRNAVVTFSEAFLGLFLATLLGLGTALVFQFFPRSLSGIG